MNNPKISVIMPVYNSGKYLSTAVNSILNQSFKDFELILIDDGSTDGSSELCDEYSQKDTRVKVIHKKNGGICNARNTALQIAKGDYIAFSDHDDEFTQHAFETIYKVAQRTNSDIVKFRKIEYILKGEKLVRCKTNKFESQSFNKAEIKKNLFYLKDINILNCVWDGLFKRELFKEIKFDESYKSGGEDIAIMYDLISVINKLSIINKVFYKHYIRRGFSTSTKFNLYNIESKKRLAIHMNIVLDKLKINKNEASFDYVYYLLKFVYFPVIAILSGDECTLHIKEKKEIIREMMQSNYTPSYFKEQSIWQIYKKSPKLGFGYFLLKNSLYRLLFLMFNIRSKNS